MDFFIFSKIVHALQIHKNSTIIIFYSYGKQGIKFYTQTKTVTQLWRDTDVTHTQAAVAMPTMK